MRRQLVFILLLFSCKNAISQIDTLKKSQKSNNSFFAQKYWDWGIKLGAGANGTWEVGLIRCNWGGIPWSMASGAISNEFVYDGRLFNPKISVEYSWFVVGSRISIIDYNNWRTHEFRLRPELGLTLLGFITVFYGYDIKLNDMKYDNVPIHRYFFGLNYPFENH